MTALTRWLKASINRPKRSRRSLVVDAEDRPHDHRQGDPLGVGAEREGLADRPALHLPKGDLADQLAVGGDPLAVEGRQEQFALLHVRPVVEGEHRVRAERRLQHRRVRLAGVHLGGRAGEDLFDEVRPGDVDEAAEEGEADGEDVAVATLQARSGSRAARARSAAPAGRPASSGRVGASFGRCGRVRRSGDRCLLHRLDLTPRTGWTARLLRRRSCGRRRAGPGPRRVP